MWQSGNLRTCQALLPRSPDEHPAVEAGDRVEVERGRRGPAGEVLPQVARHPAPRRGPGPDHDVPELVPVQILRTQPNAATVVVSVVITVAPLRTVNVTVPPVTVPAALVTRATRFTAAGDEPTSTLTG